MEDLLNQDLATIQTHILCKLKDHKSWEHKSGIVSLLITSDAAEYKVSMCVRIIGPHPLVLNHTGPCFFTAITWLIKNIQFITARLQADLVNMVDVHNAFSGGTALQMP